MVWSGDKDKIEFNEFANAMKNWAEVLHGEGAEMMETYEVSKLPVEDNDLDEEAFPDIKRFSRLLYHQLVSCLTRDPQSFVKNAKRGQGMTAWREILQCYDPQSQVD